VKALSVREPWATLICRYGKDVENRSRRMGYRGPLVICASKTVERVEESVYRSSGFTAELQPGMAIGVVEVVGCDERWTGNPWEVDG
jgi:hypothetical protein